jgi:23S rRNA (adenine2503-C2)-methyltransferase
LHSGRRLRYTGETVLPILTEGVRAPLDLLGLTTEEVIREARLRLPSGGGAALKVYRRAILDGRFEPEAFCGSEESVRAWREHFTLRLPKVVRLIDEPSDLGPTTIKVVLATDDGMELECVRIPMGGDRYTLCVSSQVGCKLACKFCETGRMGLLRSLTAAEIVSQVVVATAVLGWTIRNIVFMGMGEPLDNTDNLIQALRVLNDSSGLHFGQQRLRVCTVGKPDGIARLGALGWKRMDLSISLNAATDEKRTKLMPINKTVPLAELKRALADYPKRRNFVFGINWCLLPGINDTREDAREVAAFVDGIGRALVNVIPYNPGSEPITRAPTEEEIERFLGWLKEEGLPVQRRITKGRSVMAACGQLGNLELRKQRRAERQGAQ